MSMNFNLYFAWPVAQEYRWVLGRPSPPPPPEWVTVEDPQKEPDLVLKKHPQQNPDWFIVEHSQQKKDQRPLHEYPELFLQFAAADPTRESILKLAATYGLLGKPVLVYSPDKNKPLW